MVTSTQPLSNRRKRYKNVYDGFDKLNHREIDFCDYLVVELVVTELVEASKRPQEKVNKANGFDRLSNRRILELKESIRIAHFDLF